MISPRGENRTRGRNRPSGIGPSAGTSRASHSNRTRRFRRLARSGFAANGLLHLVIGALAISLAFGDSSERLVDQSGIFGLLAATIVGRVLLWAAVAGFGALGLWQISRGVVLEGSNFGRTWGPRIRESFKGLAYLALGGTALIFALGGSTSSSAGVRSLTSSLLGSPIGVLLLLAIGCSFFGAGVGFIAIGIRRGFRKLLRMPRGRSRLLVLILGASGYIAKGIALVLVGLVSLAATVSGVPEDSFGLDAALRALATLPFGTVFLAIVGFGLELYGVFLIARAKLARL
ncbi:DUF1206 domain-containing protein [soil metagenome]